MGSRTQRSWTAARQATSSSATAPYARSIALPPGIGSGLSPTWAGSSSAAAPRAARSEADARRRALAAAPAVAATPQRPQWLSRELLLAPLPALLGALALSLWLALHAADPAAETAERARLLASQAAPLVADALAAGDHAAVARIIRSLNRQPESAYLRIADADGRLAAEDGRRLAQGRPAAVAARRVHVDKPIFDDSASGHTLGSVRVDMALPADTARSGAYPLIAIVTAALVAVSLLAGAWLARRRRAPVRELAAAVQRLAAGELDVRIPVTESGEFGALQRGVNATASSMRSGLGQLDLQIHRATRLLARKNAELVAANADKTRFLAAASHDLRQPLHALNLFTANLREGERDCARLERIGQVQQCVESLDRLFTGLLDVSRLDAGAEQPAATSFSLDALFVEVSQNFRAVAEARGLRLVVRQTPLWVRCDRAMLARVLNNLVCNAIRYTGSGGVLLGARVRGGQVRIDVWDTGVGIAAEHQPRIFDEFVRFADCTGDRGLGLGLATVKRLCRLIDAPLQFRSQPGAGTVFQLLLPRVAAERVPRRDHGAAGDLRGLRVLVIDDEAAILDGMGPLLQSWGCDSVVAESLEDAQRQLGAQGFMPDLVISDLRLRQGRNGIDAIRAIRAGAGAQHKPAAMLITGETCALRAREAAQLQLPMLCKPVAPAALRQAIAATMATARG